ncbi:MAG: sarcosine oxidase subunit gamma [Pseudomonadota bacterium]
MADQTMDRASPFAEPIADAARHGVTLTAVPRGSLWQIAAWPDSFGEIETALAKTCGCAAPAPGRAVKTEDDRLLIRVEPLKWWVVGPDGAECPLSPDPEQGAWLDMSHDQAGIAVEGKGADELLKRFVSIDLRERAFPDLSFATTQAHHMITRVLRRDLAGTPRYEVLVMRSYGDNLHEILAHHLHRLA